MLKGIHAAISPELLYVMAQMGHGDELAIVDLNFPAAGIARHLAHDRVLTIGTRLDLAVQVITELMPLDSFVPAAATSMQVVGDAEAIPEAIAGIIPIVGRAGSALRSVERFDFYEAARNCFAIVQCQDMRHYANVILKKGVLPPA